MVIITYYDRNAIDLSKPDLQTLARVRMYREDTTKREREKDRSPTQGALWERYCSARKRLTGAPNSLEGLHQIDSLGVERLDAKKKAWLAVNAKEFDMDANDNVKEKPPLAEALRNAGFTRYRGGRVIVGNGCDRQPLKRIR